MRKAAERHLHAGEQLDDSRADVAGYLFGLAAECALKELMRLSGMGELPAEDRRVDPFYSHFEVLKTRIRDTATGRLTAQLRRFCESGDFMQHWDISMRYSDGRDIDRRWVAKWHANAKEVIETMRDN